MFKLKLSLFSVLILRIFIPWLDQLAAQSVFAKTEGASYYTIQEKNPHTFLDPANKTIKVNNYFYHFIYSKGKVESFFDVGYNFKIAYQEIGSPFLRFSMRELYLSLDVGANGFLLAGRKITDWGKGFYKRPAAVLDPERSAQDINDNFNRYKGSDQIMFKYFLENISITSVVATDLDKREWKQQALWALKESGVFSGIELSFIQGGYQKGKYFAGLTYTYVPTDIWELYGEAIYVNRSRFYHIYENAVHDDKREKIEFTLGSMLTIPWKDKRDIRWIVEFYYNSNGWDKLDLQNYKIYIEQNYTNMFISDDPVLREIARNNYIKGTSLFKIDRLNRMNLFSVLDNLPPLPGGLYFRPVIIYSLIDGSYIFQLSFNKSITRFAELMSYANSFGGPNGSLYGSIPYRYEIVLGINIHF